MDNLDIFDTETKIYLIKILNESSPFYEKQFYSAYKLISLIDIVKFKSLEDKDYLKKIVEFGLFLSVNMLDISIPFKTFLKNNSTYYERFYSIKNMIISLNEGYKKLFHFKEDKRKNSMWKVTIGKVIEKYYNEEMNIYNELTKHIENYENLHQNFILKRQRSIFLHYEGELMVYANEIKKINASEIITNTKDYILLINKLQKFTHEIFQNFTSNYTILK